MSMTRSTSFPCLLCGKELLRGNEENEAQPDDGVMCSSAGNYGSTVWDSLHGDVIRFNICDPCFAQAGEQGRLFVGQEYQPVLMDDAHWYGVWVGMRSIERPYVPWNVSLPPSDDHEYLTKQEVLDRYDDERYRWNLSREHFEAWSTDGDGTTA